jgi:hypothetical protein
MARKIFGGVDLQSQKAINVADPSAGTDAATKQYVDNLTDGKAFKQAVRVATVANGTLASAFENGDTVNAVVLVTGDRILIKDQTAGQENGIYVVNASGAPTRAADMSTAAETRAATVTVEEGTVDPNTQWTQTADNVTLGTTPLVFAKSSAGVPLTASLGVVRVGDDFRAVADPTDDSIEIVAGGIKVKAGARTKKYAQDVGAMTGGTPVTITHGLGSLDVTVQVVIKGTGEVVDLDVIVVSTTTITLTSATSQSAAFFRVTVIG